jgi:hypothetical protein
MGCSGLTSLVTDLLFNCGKPNSNLLATDFYNETWMHRIALQLCAQLRIVGSPMSLTEGAWWHSEGRLGSPFLRLPRGTPGGELKNFADGYTKADATLGHFRLWGEGEIRPNADASQFVIGEAKMASRLSPGVTHDKANYNQAARTVACMAHLLSVAGCRPEAVTTLGFYVVAPELQIRRGVFSEQTERTHILATVAAKVDGYRSGLTLDSSEKRAWFETWFVPTVEHVQISVISWERVIDLISARDPEAGGQFADFYAECLKYCRFYSVSMIPA